LAPKSTALGNMTQNTGYDAMQGHSRSPLSVKIGSLYATSYSVLVNYILSRTVSKISLSLSKVGACLYRTIWGEPLNSGLRNLASEN